MGELRRPPKKFYRSKTFWTTVATAAGTIGALVAGEVNAVQAAQILVPALVGLFIRDGVGLDWSLL